MVNMRSVGRYGMPQPFKHAYSCPPTLNTSFYPVKMCFSEVLDIILLIITIRRVGIDNDVTCTQGIID